MNITPFKGLQTVHCAINKKEVLKPVKASEIREMAKFPNYGANYYTKLNQVKFGSTSTGYEKNDYEKSIDYNNYSGFWEMQKALKASNNQREFIEKGFEQQNYFGDPFHNHYNSYSGKEGPAIITMLSGIYMHNLTNFMKEIKDPMLKYELLTSEFEVSETTCNKKTIKKNGGSPVVTCKSTFANEVVEPAIYADEEFYSSERNKLDLRNMICDLCDIHDITDDMALNLLELYVDYFPKADQKTVREKIREYKFKKFAEEMNNIKDPKERYNILTSEVELDDKEVSKKRRGLFNRKKGPVYGSFADEVVGKLINNAPESAKRELEEIIAALVDDDSLNNVEKLKLIHAYSQYLPEDSQPYIEEYCKGLREELMRAAIES